MTVRVTDKVRQRIKKLDNYGENVWVSTVPERVDEVSTTKPRNFTG